MDNFNGKENPFSRESLAAAIQIWNRAAISLIDIRHNLISPGEPILSYRLPAGMFLYTSGKAEISLNDTVYSMERFGLFHGGKGAELTIRPIESWLEYYMVIYKAVEPPLQRREYARLIESTNPFRQQYGFPPEKPIFISELLRNMYEKWKGSTPLNLFYGKTAFYQLVYEVYEELERGDIFVFEPDIVAMAKQYLDEHYGNEIVIQDLCGMLGVSYSHFYKSFKEKIGNSPQEYLIHVRLSAAKNWLQHSEMPMRMIADSAGFANERNFYRTFAKHFGISPNTFRKNTSLQNKDYVIGNMIPFPYNGKSQVSLDQLIGKGGALMLKQIRSKTVVAAALSLILLMTACSTASVDTNGEDLTTKPAETSQVTETEAEEPVEEGTRTVNTVMGDVEVPLNPKRVIVQYLMGDLVSLNVIPIGITEVHKGAAFESVITDSKTLSQWEFEPEEVMELEPDLIVLASDTQYEDMSKIAPTVLVPYGTMTMEERMTFLGEVLGREDEAKAALAQYETAISDGKAKLAEAGLADITISAMQVTDDNISVVGNMHSLGVILYNGLGLEAPEAVQKDIIDAGAYWGSPSMEVLADYCGDYVLHLGDVQESISENTVWQSIPAVEAGNVLIMDTAFTYYTDIYSSTAMVNNVIEQILNAQSQ